MHRTRGWRLGEVFFGRIGRAVAQFKAQKIRVDIFRPFASEPALVYASCNDIGVISIYISTPYLEPVSVP